MRGSLNLACHTRDLRFPRDLLDSRGTKHASAPPQFVHAAGMNIERDRILRCRRDRNLGEFGEHAFEHRSEQVEVSAQARSSSYVPP